MQILLIYSNAEIIYKVHNYKATTCLVQEAWLRPYDKPGKKYEVLINVVFQVGAATVGSVWWCFCEAGQVAVYRLRRAMRLQT